MTSNNLFRKFLLKNHSLLLVAIFMGSLAFTSCKKQPVATGPTAEEQMIAQAKSELQALLNNESMSIEEKERRLQAIKDKNIQDAEVQSLIAQVEAQIAKAKAEQLRMEEEEKRRQAELERQRKLESSPAYKLNNFFNSIGSASSADAANAQISQALGLFSSPSAPVLIIIAQSGGITDYDEPTTIQKYLNYLKDQKKKADTIENIVFDDAGKIKELELTKLR
mgnify:CR=1 FL=1